MNLLSAVACLALVHLPTLRANDTAVFAMVRQADEQRIAATLAGDLKRLDAVLSEDLRYAYSDGRVQTKRQFMSATADKKVRYISASSPTVEFQDVTPGAVAMSGVTQVVVEAAGTRASYRLRFLAIWRDEAGQWRLLSYQSTALPENPP